MQVVGQILSIIAMAIAILSFQCKVQRTHIAMQIVSTLFFAVSFLILGAVTGALLNVIANVRAIVYYNKKKLLADKPIWLVGFILAYAAVYVLTFTFPIFKTEPTVFNLIVGLLPVIGMTASNLGLYCKDAKAVRRFGLITSPAWLIYNIIYFSIGAILCEAFSIVSIIIGMIRLDMNKRSEE